MEIAGWKLPVAFLRVIADGSLNRQAGSWPLRSATDTYGHPLETELGEVYQDQRTILRETLALPDGFDPTVLIGADSEDYSSEPGFIPDITDFRAIVCFGIAGDGAPFCLDFREDPQNPSIIWWDDVYWRRIAPDFVTFLGLFDLTAP
jgi:hypothetical protein